MEFIDEFMNDEDDSGSELDFSDDEWPQQAVPKQEMDIEFIEVKPDIRNMPTNSMWADETTHHDTVAGHHVGQPDSSTQQNSPKERDRSPLRVTKSSQGNDDSEGTTGMQQAKAKSACGRGRGRPRGSRSRGGRIGRPITRTDIEQRGSPVKEVCVDDADVPPRLRDMVHELESSCQDRKAQQMEKRESVKNSGNRVHEENVDSNSDSDEEFYDAESYMAHELFGGCHEVLEFKWFPMASFNGRGEKFQSEQIGYTCYSSCAYDAFRKFWDNDILEHIVRETNRYALELKSSSEGFGQDWYDTNVHEILILFAFWIMLGIIRMPSIKSCFSNSPVLKTSVFRTLMTENRYWALNKALHFVDNATRRPDSSQLFCLGPIPNHLNKKFMECYAPGQDIAIYESLKLKGRLFKNEKNVKSEPTRLSIKTFELCECATGYVCSFFIYLGKDQTASTSRLPRSVEVVVKLMRPLLNKGHRLFLSDWFNSPLLARFLKSNKTDCVGILRKSRVPPLIQLFTIPEGSCIARHSDDVVVMAYQQRKPIYTISTCHGTKSVTVLGGPNIHYKPAVIVDYNSHIVAVDEKDHLLDPYLNERNKFIKWYKKLFKRLLNVSIFNSRILVDRSQNKQVKQQAFRSDLVQEIIQRHAAQVPKPRQRHMDTANSYDLPAYRLTGAHFVVRSSVAEDLRTDGRSRTSRNRRNCVWCMVREKKYCKTVYMCDHCEVPLCLEGCFKKFHTVQ